MATTRRTTILADPDLLERIERLARRERTTKTAVIVAALESYLEMREAPSPMPFLAVGRSGHGRLSLDGRSIVRRELGRRDPVSGETDSGVADGRGTQPRAPRPPR